MQLIYCALFTALAFPDFTGWSDRVAFAYLAQYPLFTCCFAAVAGSNAVVGYLLAPLAMDKVGITAFDELVLDAFIDAFVTAFIAGLLFAMECFLIALLFYGTTDWFVRAHAHFVVFRIPIAVATTCAIIMIGPLPTKLWAAAWRSR